ncbi:PIG-L deacetylase family protein [Vallitalea okinawensis]|uniref:PIG-L deacetylase family protein n=1 Tax=Vallitalea okinawensis TaxID=2078660 RepID=UPI001300838B|nr:PIG-L family deacetylase [Vallitalea okinawensis]
MLDILFIGAHPDDEGNITGTLIKARKAGKKVGILTLTKGESSGVATAEEREIEMQRAAKVIGAAYLKHLDLPDAGVKFCDETVNAIIEVLVETKPRTVITTYPIDCHPDHVAVSHSVDKALFVASLKKHMGDEPWDLKQVFYLSLDSSANSKKPDLIIDVTDVIDEKYEATKCHASQGVADPQINIAKINGKMGGFAYGEALYRGVQRQHPIKLKSFEPLLIED